MQDKGLDFRHKEVINITDGKRLGYVQDVCADLESGMITSIIVPGGNNKFLNMFSQSNDIVIPWPNIKCIGEDLILVEI
ncbi:MAG: YlmC/YmxH family sporulation protein [Clostridia bacterium]|nr:YlmC/YmxH family sporulation protein [Clostridia bacterium]